MSKWILLALVSFSALASEHHIPLDLTFEESQKWYQSFEHKLNTKIGSTKVDSEITMAISSGDVLGKWLNKINETRAENPIRLTSESTRTGIPIDNPKMYGPKTVKATHEEFEKDMPKELFAVFFKNARYSETLPVAEDVFIEWAQKVSKHYQSAVRWTGMQRWIGHYTQRRFQDVRGYYELGKIKDLDKKLRTFKEQSSEDKSDLKKHLLGICYNKYPSTYRCAAEFKRYLAKNQMKEYKDFFWKSSKELWESFFNISNPRRDVTWNSSNPYLMEIPFKDPERGDIANWLKENVEDEFKREAFGWNLVLNYVSRGSGLSKLEFKAGVTPHVSAGNLIVMDANTSLEEYAVKWTIRHEYGHILRLPDCYMEFYDPDQELMVNYQLDTTDLMCSRAGDMNDRIYHELKRVYFKNI